MSYRELKDDDLDSINGGIKVHIQPGFRAANPVEPVVKIEDPPYEGGGAGDELGGTVGTGNSLGNGTPNQGIG